jgi:hypothetical protein
LQCEDGPLSLDFGCEGMAEESDGGDARRGSGYRGTGRNFLNLVGTERMGLQRGERFKVRDILCFYSGPACYSCCFLLSASLFAIFSSPECVSLQF